LNGKSPEGPHKKTGEMICTTDAEGVIDAQRESQQVTDELIPYWRQYRDLFIARDLSQLMREIIDGMNAVSLRQAGGVYCRPGARETERSSRRNWSWCRGIARREGGQSRSSPRSPAPA